MSSGLKKNELLRITALACIICFFAGLFAGFLLPNPLSRKTEDPVMKLHRQNSGRYTNPLLSCEFAEGVINNETRPIKAEVEKSVRTTIGKKMADSVSVYFRELNDGISFTLGPGEKFFPASLMKVPLLVAVLKQAETSPGFLNRKLKLADEPDYSKVVYKPAVKMTRGHSYTIEDLLSRMIVYSDNNAASLLEETVDVKTLAAVYHDLGVSSPYVRNTGDYVSAYNYSTLFRILFNASYLSHEMSEKALTYLASADFKEGLVGGVPGFVPVAHKFGEWTEGAEGEIKELHDCGIIYYPLNPYLLCIMSRGSSFEYLDDSIRDISRAVFDQINAQRKAVKR